MSTETAHAWVPTDSFGSRLVLTRRELGLSVKDAADMCGLHYATWSTWENGRKPANMAAVVRAISDGLGVSRDWLMWGGPPMAPFESQGETKATYQYPRLTLVTPVAA